MLYENTCFYLPFGLAIGYIAVAMLGISTGDLIDSMLNVQAVDGVWQKLAVVAPFACNALLKLLSLFDSAA